MTLETVIIGTTRLLGALPVLRWAFVGGLIAIAVDLSDLFQRNLIDLGGIEDYQSFDKYADLAYMATFLIVALRWTGPARDVAVALFGYRMIGVATFELTGARAVLIFFPNLFEFWFLFVAFALHWRPGWLHSGRTMAAFGALLLALKLLQEYALHVGKWLDDFTAIEAVEAIWDWLVGPPGWR